ncbi:MAG: NIPSNAP family protein [Vicinamibacterales bacterium]
MLKPMKVAALVGVAFAAGFAVKGLVGPVGLEAQSQAQGATRVFEIRTYTSPDAERLKALHARFREHTMRVFAKHGMTSVAYFAPQDAPLSQNTLVYFISHASREQAVKNWAEFRLDPEWVKVAADSNVNGNIVTKVESVFANATDYSPLK